LPDGKEVDLIFEVDVDDTINTNSLIFIRKSTSSADQAWHSVGGGAFEIMPAEDGLRLRGKITTDSFSLWGVGCCHAKVAAHHICIGQERKLRFIFYSGEPKGSHPIPRDLKDVRTCEKTHAPLLSGFSKLKGKDQAGTCPETWCGI
jgi:hypothetical protein